MAVRAVKTANVQAAILISSSRQPRSFVVACREMRQPTLSVERAWIESYLLQDAHDRSEPLC